MAKHPLFPFEYGDEITTMTHYHRYKLCRFTNHFGPIPKNAALYLVTINYADGEIITHRRISEVNEENKLIAMHRVKFGCIAQY